MAAEMTTEVAETMAPPPVGTDAAEATEAKPAKERKKEKKREDAEGGDDESPRARLSAELKKLTESEDATLRDIVDALGDEGSFTIKIWRQEPEWFTDGNGKRHSTRGYLETVDRKIDEQWIQNKYGGGTYKLTIRKRGGGYLTHRTIPIAGNPDLSTLPNAAAQPTQQLRTEPAEPPPIIGKALDMMQSQLDKAEARADRAAGGNGSDSALLAIMREQLAAASAEKLEMQRRLDELAAAIRRPAEPTAEDKFKDRFLEKMIDQDSARITALRAQYESEIRQLKESAIENERRIRDQHERDLKDRTASHERELALVRQTFEAQIATLKASHEISLATVKASGDTTTKITEAETRRLDKENNHLREELKELRAKKEKTIAEMVKELNSIKELVGDEGEEASTAEKIVEAVTNPDAIAAVTSIFQKNQPAAATPPQAMAPQRPERRVVKNRVTGEKMILEGNQLRPAKKISPPGTPPEVAALPEIDPEDIKRVVDYLESACTAGTDPQIVISSFGSFIPEPIRVAVRDLGGVDQFLMKVAKLPSTSPLLANQAGKNWCRKLSKALAGE